MASGMTPGKRFAVRMSLVTGSTLAMILGAQSLVALDTRIAATSMDNTVAAAPTTSADTSSSILNAPPNIVIIRHSGQNSDSQTVNPSTSQSQSTAPVVVQPPAPVVVQPQAPSTVRPFRLPRTRSSR